ncbi:mitochondrial ribosomal death-associated protein 3-domain-containing protein [Suillus occidentalis]|nr:mitochondrial ribosomal death-associated protein 3-domain-containing protein [Suillus occidentalis]
MAQGVAWCLPLWPNVDIDMKKASVLAIEGTSGSDGSGAWALGPGEDLKRGNRDITAPPANCLLRRPQVRSFGRIAMQRSQIVKQASQGFKGKKSTSSGQMELAKTDKKVMQMLTRIVESPALKFPHNDNDPFCIFELLRNILVKFRVLSKLCSVICDEQRNQQVSIDIFSAGPQGCGKSFLLLHALQYCNARDWLVLYIPRATNLVNSTTAHTYDMRTRTYLQPIFAYQILQRFLKINAPRLEQLRTQTEIEIERCPPVPPDTPLVELINVGLKDQCHALTVLDAVLAEIGRQTITHLDRSHLIKTRPAVSLWCVLTEQHNIPATEFPEAPPPPPEYDRPYGPYVKRQPELVDHAHGLERLAVPASLSVPEAASVFELWMKDRAVPSKPNDELFLAKYTEASGNARAFIWKELTSSMSA